MARREVGACSSGPTCPGCVSFPGGVLPSRLSPWSGLSPPQSTTLDTNPQPHRAGVPLASPATPPSHVMRHGVEVPAWFRRRVAPAVPPELSTIHRRGPRAGAAGVSHVLRRLSACMPRPEDSGGPSPPRPHGWSCMACGVRANPRHPHQAPLRSCTSPAGDAAPPTASRIRCLRLVQLVRRAFLATPPWTPDALRVGGSPLPDRDFHPARDAKLSWRKNAGAHLLLEADAT